MVTAEFLSITDELIRRFEDKKALYVNGNVLVAIPQVREKTEAGILLSEGAKEHEQRMQGFGRIIALPANLNPEAGDAPLKVGDFADFVHTSTYKKDPKVLRHLIKANIPENFLYIVSDPEFLCLWPKESVDVLS